MKKILSFTIAFLLVTLISLSAFSADTTFEGEFRIRSYSEWNFDKKFNDATKEEFDGWFEQRFRLTITHTSSEYIKAVVRLDLVEDTWGQGRAMKINNYPDPGYGGLPFRGNGIIDHAYLEFMLPTLGTFRVGKFPVIWGHGMFFSYDSPGLDGFEWSKEWGQVTTTFLYAKDRDNIYQGPTSSTYNHDYDFYALHLGYTPHEDHLIELYGGFYDWGRGNARVGWVALAYTGNISEMIDIKAEAGYIFGKFVRLSDSEHDELYGYSVYLDVSYYNELFRLGIAFLMMSGVEEIGHWNFPYWNRDTFIWGNIIGNDGGGLNSRYYAQLGNWPLSGWDMHNITSIKLYFEICPVERLTLNFALMWAQFTESVGLDTFYLHPAWYTTAPIRAIEGDTKELGWEIDFGFSYEIIEGLTYTFSAGVLFTGDGFDYIDRTTDRRHNWGEIWSVVNELKYEF